MSEFQAENDPSETGSYYQRHRERLLEYQRNYYNEKVKSKLMERTDDEKEQRAKYLNEYRKQNPDKCKQHREKWRTANKEKCREYTRQYRARKAEAAKSTSAPES